MKNRSKYLPIKGIIITTTIPTAMAYSSKWYFFFVAGPHKSLKSIAQQVTPFVAHIAGPQKKNSQLKTCAVVDQGAPFWQNDIHWILSARHSIEKSMGMSKAVPSTKSCAEDFLTAGLAGISGALVVVAVAGTAVGSGGV